MQATRTLLPQTKDLRQGKNRQNELRTYWEQGNKCNMLQTVIVKDLQHQRTRPSASENRCKLYPP